MKENDSEKKGRPLARITFNCIFTETIRRIFRQKRLRLGLPYHRLAEIFDVNWSTIRKWEMGPTISCELSYRPKIEAFINGEYDQEFGVQGKTGNQVPAELYELPVDSPMFTCMEHIANTYLLCQHDKTISNSLMDDIENASKKAISRLIMTEFSEIYDDNTHRRPQPFSPNAVAEDLLEDFPDSPPQNQNGQ